MALADQLVSYWKLDESSGNAADSVGVNTLTSTGVDFVAGKINNGGDYEIDDVNDTLLIADATQVGLDFTADLSISLWFKPESAPATDTEMVLVSKYNSTGAQRAYYIGYRDNSSVKELHGVISSTGGTGGAITNISATQTLNNGTFYHIVMTQKSSATTALKIYFNGTEVATTATQTAIFNSLANFRIGNSDNLDSEPDGVIDEVGVWSRVLTPSEITTLYNSGAGNQYPFTEIVSGSSLLTTLNAG